MVVIKFKYINSRGNTVDVAIPIDKISYVEREKCHSAKKLFEYRLITVDGRNFEIDSSYYNELEGKMHLLINV